MWPSLRFLNTSLYPAKVDIHQLLVLLLTFTTKQTNSTARKINKKLCKICIF